MIPDIATIPPARIFIGLMSGTSLDSVDAALVHFHGYQIGETVGLVRHYEEGWPSGLRRRLLALMNGRKTTAGEVAALNVDAGAFFAAVVNRAMAQWGVSRQDIRAIGSHGQTVHHHPPRRGRLGCTLQLGDPSVIAQLTQITTVGNFRLADMAQGGQGAPLVPWADVLLFSHCMCDRCVQNIGGIANVTWVPFFNGADVREPVEAFDTGPGNLVLDNLMELLTDGRMHCDVGGKLAAAGTVDEKLLRRLLQHPFFRKRPPKSTGREEFGRGFAEKMLGYRRHMRVVDLLATATELTARSIAQAYKRFLPRMPEQIILCGGGAENSELVRRLTLNLQRVGCKAEMAKIDECGLPNKAKEAASFALLAAATIDGMKAGMPTVTGAKVPVTLGVVAYP